MDEILETRRYHFVPRTTGKSPGLTSQTLRLALDSTLETVSNGVCSCNLISIILSNTLSENSIGKNKEMPESILLFPQCFQSLQKQILFSANALSLVYDFYLVKVRHLHGCKYTITFRRSET